MVHPVTNEPLILQPGDEPDPDCAAAITNPQAWENGEVPPVTPPPVSEGLKGEGDGDGGDQPPVDPGAAPEQPADPDPVPEPEVAPEEELPEEGPAPEPVTRTTQRRTRKGDTAGK